VKALRFKLDEEWYDLPSEMETFGALRDWVSSKLKEEDRVLLGIMSGDTTLRAEDIESSGDCLISQFDALEFYSAAPAILACRTCGDLIEFMDVLEERGERMRAGIEAQDHGTIALRFKECIEGWNLVLQGLRNLIQVANMDSSTVEIGGQSLSAAAASMRGITLKMADAFTRGDMASLNVMVTEELGEFINPLREVFERVLEKLEETAV
jgi:hypothetical protein